MPVKKESSITILPPKPSSTISITPAPTVVSHVSAPVLAAPSAASPLRQRLKQRMEENAVEIKEEPKKQKDKKKTSPAKSKKENKAEPKKIPKVFASPSWYKSPTQKKIHAKNKQFDELRDLFRKDGNNTEEGINKIISDLKF